MRHVPTAEEAISDAVNVWRDHPHRRHNALDGLSRPAKIEALRRLGFTPGLED